MVQQIEPIRGKIARVIDPRKIALNVGQEDGVESEMEFDILSSAGLPIRDPDTGEQLGFVDLPKARVKISSVYDKFSVAVTFRTQRVNVGGIGGVGALGTLFQPPKWENRLETLKIKESDDDADVESDEQSNFVAISDRVVQVLPGG